MHRQNNFQKSRSLISSPMGLHHEVKLHVCKTAFPYSLLKYRKFRYITTLFSYRAFAFIYWDCAVAFRIEFHILVHICPLSGCDCTINAHCAVVSKTIGNVLDLVQCGCFLGDIFHSTYLP